MDLICSGSTAFVSFSHLSRIPLPTRAFRKKKLCSGGFWGERHGAAPETCRIWSYRRIALSLYVEVLIMGARGRGVCLFVCVLLRVYREVGWGR